MRIAVVYRQKSDHARSVTDFKELLRRRYPSHKLTEFEIDSREGAAEAVLYGITVYPAIIVTNNDGAMLGLWEGEPLPLLDEVMAAALE